MKKKIIDLIDKTIESGLKYSGNLETLNYYQLFCKATASEFLFKIDSKTNACSYKYKFNDENSLMIIFSIPLNDDRNFRSKFISEKIMEIISECEDIFTSIDYYDFKEIKNEKFVYLVIVKKIED